MGAELLVEDEIFCCAFEEGVGTFWVFCNGEEAGTLHGGYDHVADLVGCFATAEFLDVETADAEELGEAFVDRAHG